MEGVYRTNNRILGANPKCFLISPLESPYTFNSLLSYYVIISSWNQTIPSGPGEGRVAEPPTKNHGLPKIHMGPLKGSIIAL
jgi:hypothetical protein